MQISSPRAQRKWHGRCLTVLQAASAVVLRKTQELWLNVTASLAHRQNRTLKH